MKDEELEIIANKVADILERRLNERRDEVAKGIVEMLWNTPFEPRKEAETRSKE